VIKSGAHLYHCLHEQPVFQLYLVEADCFILIETEAQHIAFVQMIIVQIVAELFFTALIIGISTHHFG